MAWPDFPPPEQITVYEGVLSGDNDWAKDNSGDSHQEPVEYLSGDPADAQGDRSLKDGWYSSGELAAYLADPGGGDEDPPGTDPVTGTEEALRIAAFLGGADDQALVDLIEPSVVAITSMVKSYTRGVGFETSYPNAELEAVITTATARLVANPEQIATDVGTVSTRGGFAGWTLAETFVLNRFRKRAL